MLNLNLNAHSVKLLTHQFLNLIFFSNSIYLLQNFLLPLIPVKLSNLNQLSFLTLIYPSNTLFIFSESETPNKADFTARELKLIDFVEKLDKVIEIYWTIYYFKRRNVFVFRNDSYLRDLMKTFTSSTFSHLPLSESIYLLYNYNIQNAQDRVKFF